MKFIVHWKNGKSQECYGETVFDAVHRYLGFGSGAFALIDFAEEVFDHKIAATQAGQTYTAAPSHEGRVAGPEFAASPHESGKDWNVVIGEHRIVAYAAELESAPEEKS
jgi:hypothetical protein